MGSSKQSLRTRLGNDGHAWLQWWGRIQSRWRFLWCKLLIPFIVQCIRFSCSHTQHLTSESFLHVTQSISKNSSDYAIWGAHQFLFQRYLYIFSCPTGKAWRVRKQLPYSDNTGHGSYVDTLTTFNESGLCFQKVVINFLFSTRFASVRWTWIWLRVWLLIMITLRSFCQITSTGTMKRRLDLHA